MSKQLMTMDLHEKVEQDNGLSKKTPLVVASVSVSADPQSDLDHKEAPSSGETALVPAVKKLKSRKRKQKQQITVDSHERVEKENDSTEATPLVVDIKSVLADPRSDLDHEKAARLPGEAGALPPIEKIKSRKRKPKKQITTLVNIAEETSTPVDLHVNMEEMTQKQNIAEVVDLGSSNLFAEASLSALQDLNVSKEAWKRNGSRYSANVVNPGASNISAVSPTSDLQDDECRKKKKRNRKVGQNSANYPETSNMSTAAPASVFQRVNENIGQSDESKGLMLLKDDCLMHSSNLAIHEASNMPGVLPASDFQDSVSPKERKRNRKRGQNSANIVNPEISTTVAPTSVLHGLNRNFGPSDESKCLMPSKDDCLTHSSNIVNPEASKMPRVALISVLQEKEGGKKRKRNREQGQNSANLVNPEISNMSTLPLTSVLLGLNENISPSDESKGLMLPKYDCLMHPSNLVNPEDSNIPGVGPTSDLQENVSGKKRKRNSKREQNSTNLVNPEASGISSVATIVFQGSNGNIDPSEESKSLMLSKDDCLMHSSNLVIPEASNMPVVVPTSDLQENVSGKKRKRNKMRGQHSADIVHPESCNMASVATPSNDELMNGTVTKKDMAQHVPNSSSHICSAKVLTKKLLILDLNGLLADIVPYTNESRKHDFVLSNKYVYKRPYVDEFLEFCLERFTVAVWSSRKRRNIDPLIKFLIGTKRRRKFLFCWDQYHCTTTKFTTIDCSEKPLVLKHLRKVWNNKDPKWVMYNESNTLLLDDSPYKALLNPANTAIFPHSYRYTQVDDNALGPGGDLQIYLEGLSLADNVQEYVRNNPFGQSPITQSHPSWDFYRKVMDLYGHPVNP